MGQAAIGAGRQALVDGGDKGREMSPPFPAQRGGRRAGKFLLAVGRVQRHTLDLRAVQAKVHQLAVAQAIELA